MRISVSRIRFHSVVAAYALWILGVFVTFYLVSGQNGSALQISVLCGAIPALCQLLFLGIDWRGLVAPVKIWLVLLFIVLLSYVANGLDPLRQVPIGGDLAVPQAWLPMVYVLNMAFILSIGTIAAGCPDRRLLRSVAGLYSILAVPLLIYVILTGNYVWGRLSAGLQPIMWGLMGLTVCLGAFARPAGILAAGAFAAGVASMLESSSRESLLAIAIALLAVIPLELWEIKRSRLLAVLSGLCLAFFAAALLFDPYLLDAIHYVKHDVLWMDNPERGINSGFTGRTGVWEDAFRLWLKAPLFGVGFQQHEYFLGAPAHNSYLAMLADTGVPGLIIYLVLLVRSLIAAWGIEDRRTRRFVLAMVVAYIINGFFDRRTINAGNPLGLFFILSCSFALTDQSLRRAATMFRHPPDSLTINPALPGH